MLLEIWWVWTGARCIFFLYFTCLLDCEKSAFNDGAFEKQWRWHFRCRWKMIQLPCGHTYKHVFSFMANVNPILSLSHVRTITPITYELTVKNNKRLNSLALFPFFSLHSSILRCIRHIRRFTFCLFRIGHLINNNLSYTFSSSIFVSTKIYFDV